MFFDCNIGTMNEIFVNGCAEQIFPVLSKSILALNSFYYKTDQILLDLSDVMQVYSENNVSIENILEIPEFYTVFSDYVPQLFDFFKVKNEITPYIIDKMTNLVIILSQKILNGESLQDQYLKFLSFFNRQYLVAICYITSQNSFYAILHDTIPSVLESIVNTIPLQFSIENDTISFDREVKNSSYKIYKTILCSISRLAPNLVMEQIRKAFSNFMNEQNAFENFIRYVSIFTTVTMFALKGLPHGSRQEIVKETNNWFFTQLENPSNSDENIMFLQKIILYYYSEQRDLYHEEENQEFLTQIYFLFYQHLVVEDFVHQMFTAECLRLFLDYDYKAPEKDNLTIQPYLRDSKDNQRLLDNIGPAFQNVFGNILPPVIIPFMKFNFVVFQMTTVISLSNPELLEVVRDFEDSMCNILFQFVGQSIIEINPEEILSMETMIIGCKLCHYFPLLPYKHDNIFNDVMNQLFVNFQNITKLFHDFCMKNNVSRDSLESDEANTMRKWMDSLLEGYIETIKAFDKPEFKYIVELIHFFMTFPPYLLVPGIFKLLKESLIIFKEEIVKNEPPTFYLDTFLAENVPHNCISLSIEMIFTYIETFSENLMKLNDHMARIIQRVLFYCDYGDVEISLTAHKILCSIITKIEKSSSEIHQFYYNQPFPDESLQYTVNQYVFMEIIRLISCGVFKFAFPYYKEILHLRYFIQGVKTYLDEIADFVAAKLEVSQEKMKECIAPFILSTAKIDEEKFSRYLTAFFNKITEITYFDPELHLCDNMKQINLEKLISDASKVKDEAIPLFEPVETELLDV
ncbi:hypothetical protein TVAG_248660 [Trichomonas vaginalis G3]|uniref:Uncharacterized protein n=1 Tax=Trichomonas vaginalis (strain ATCC PRA-98 / G3) TaxID=412133 RepID=A2E7A2_TRIV3|nr:hypothetical protein TVAGG3_0283600 [Trichomonas vaginalis G3]EAY11499.1 hypothetical protein TVAG_248660 [Trichomonas vaginalis G3]KAI5526738.1 hypothetical protein TVAGG3_0283600 [Trichomonas vaginalis G3]|eukprot:XP_001323722.1 hypothetical protein [Trichomonas vaginalis G3]